MAPAPASPVREDGRLELGSYRGSFRDIDYDRVTSRIVRTVREKRWLWYCVVQDPWIVAFAVVKTGYAATAFGFVQRAGDREFLADESRMGPGSRGWVERRGGSTVARFGSDQDPTLRLDSLGSAWSVAARFGDFELDAECTHESAPLAVVARVPGGVVNATEKGEWTIQEFDSITGDLVPVWSETADVPDEQIPSMVLAAAVGSLEEQLAWTGETEVHEDVRPVLTKQLGLLRQRLTGEAPVAESLELEDSVG